LKKAGETKGILSKGKKCIITAICITLSKKKRMANERQQQNVQANQMSKQKWKSGEKRGKVRKAATW